jgi:hypothetical protein
MWFVRLLSGVWGTCFIESGLVVVSCGTYVDLMPALRWFIWPISISSITLVKQHTRLVVRPDHPLKYLVSMSLHHVEVAENPMVTW